MDHIPTDLPSTITDIAVIKTQLTNTNNLITEIRNDIKLMSANFVSGQVFLEYKKEMERRLLDTGSKSDVEQLNKWVFWLITSLILELIASVFLLIQFFVGK